MGAYEGRCHRPSNDLGVRCRHALALASPVAIVQQGISVDTRVLAVDR